ncbi:hypothetical protein CYMTET_23407 [Cymbomonas tetramitiformis]|uniref:Secreted peptide n=1 Tax=Cymbomonas tetramitiformis TaxID=36881 RepID=A0AAE0L146_9CHLO|nr:hypothetical protein CYMTET_23407 [Cymbomonas tetramitiformis]
MVTTAALLLCFVSEITRGRQHHDHHRSAFSLFVAVITAVDANTMITTKGLSLCSSQCSPLWTPTPWSPSQRFRCVRRSDHHRERWHRGHHRSAFTVFVAVITIASVGTVVTTAALSLCSSQ